MKFGFLTGCLQNMTLEEKMAYAHSVGFTSLDVSCWPRENTRDYSGSDIDVENLTDEEVEKIKGWLAKYDIEFSSLAYYDNMLFPDTFVREQYAKHLKAVIVAAERLGVPLVGCFIGKNHNKTLEENFDDFEEIFTDFVTFAESHNVKLMIENCPMPGWEKDGLPGTISYSPELWDEMFRRVPSKSFGLNFDPSHLNWLHIDYLQCLRDYKDRIFHIDAKDSIVDEKKFAYYGIFGKKLNREHEEDLGFWTPVIPGLGDINWDQFVKVVKETGYQGVISIEHEDKRFAETNDKVKQGLEFSYNVLNPIINEF
ncbi:sugar phosphate isomerase/epimerase family protein [Lactococcus cremoris]|uniref:sugar phosphate isomerase/epimerase family protein n=1 Tax=Lactococcus lactis subsp. cremoris TaxID=1359 RepID=UPI002871FCD7|nr:sugar phosphate isomerase/epimerase family protein [Lactococcus cremoris]MDR9868224.1 sugar phosphate isomerase/epimerase family protein [Lactococcus cremoris]